MELRRKLKARGLSRRKRIARRGGAAECGRQDNHNNTTHQAVKVLPGFHHVNPVFLSGKSWLEINTWEGRSTAVKSLMIKNYPVIIIKPWLSFIYFLPPRKYVI
jgi:hypothetical protein